MDLPLDTGTVERDPPNTLVMPGSDTISMQTWVIPYPEKPAVYGVILYLSKAIPDTPEGHIFWHRDNACFEENKRIAAKWDQLFITGKYNCIHTNAGLGVIKRAGNIGLTKYILGY